MYNKKNYASVIFNTLLTIQILTGFVVIIFSEYQKGKIIKYVGPLESQIIESKIYFSEFYGFHLIISYLSGFPLAKKCAKEHYKSNLGILLKIWNLFALTTAVDGVIGSILWFTSAETIITTIETSLKTALELYCSNANWRLLWDDLQYHQKCCGIQNYGDWKAIVYLEYSYESDLALSENQQSNDGSNLIPYSCCRRNIDCFQSNYPEYQEFLQVNSSQINEKGCLDILADNIDFITLVQISIGIFGFIIQILILIVMRILFLKNRSNSSVESSDSECQTNMCEEISLIAIDDNKKLQISTQSEEIYEEETSKDDIEDYHHNTRFQGRSDKKVTFYMTNECEAPVILH